MNESADLFFNDQTYERRSHGLTLIGIQALRSMSAEKSLLLSYMISVSVYFGTCELKSPMLSFLQLISGMFVFIITPGVVLAVLVFPSNLVNLATAMLSGIVFCMLSSHILYTLTLLTGFVSTLPSWLLASETAIVLAGLTAIRCSGYESIIRRAFTFPIDKWTAFVVMCGVGLRVALFVYADGCIAPDAALYSSYAREIIDGSFKSFVFNDDAVYVLSETSDYIAHHGFTYIFAISWLLMEPSLQGPTVILQLIGILLILMTFLLTKQIFNEESAKWTTRILSFLPLFVFHSSVGYGPEISSLLLLVSAALLISNHSTSYLRIVFAGILIGLVDVVWYANFYIICLIFPVVCFFNRKQKGDYKWASLLFPFALIARVVYQNSILFYTLWISVFALLIILEKTKSRFMSREIALLLLGIFIVLVGWRWPLQFKHIISSNQVSFVDPNPFFSLLSSSAVVGRIPSFLSFLVLHLSPTIFILVLLAAFGKTSRKELVFLVSGGVSSIGTLLVLSTIAGSLQFTYFFSDSRFFLLQVLSFVIFAGPFIARLSDSKGKEKKLSPIRVLKLRGRTRNDLIAFFIIIGFIPSCLVMPAGLSLIRIEERYGWGGLEADLRTVGSEESIFIVDRAREFAWLTSRPSVVLEFSTSELPIESIALELLNLANEYSAEYILVDDYTIANWDVLGHLLRDPMGGGTTLPLNISAALSRVEMNETLPMEALTLILETQPNALGRFSRVFQFGTAVYFRKWDSKMLDLGWDASNQGILSNHSGIGMLTIGPGQNYTNTWRPGGSDLLLGVSGGYIVVSLTELGAKVNRIGLHDSSGRIISYATEVWEGLYFSAFGEVTLGDIRITIEGGSGESILINSVTLWETL